VFNNLKKRYCNCDTKWSFNDLSVNKQYVIGISVIKRGVLRFFWLMMIKWVIQSSFKVDQTKIKKILNLFIQWYVKKIFKIYLLLLIKTEISYHPVFSSFTNLIMPDWYHQLSMPGAGNNNLRRRLSTVDPLNKVACFVKHLYIFILKKSLSKLVSTRRSTILSLPC
jgi:hypothetical protein